MAELQSWDFDFPSDHFLIKESFNSKFNIKLFDTIRLTLGTSFYWTLKYILQSSLVYKADGFVVMKMTLLIICPKFFACYNGWLSGFSWIRNGPLEGDYTQQWKWSVHIQLGLGSILFYSSILSTLSQMKTIHQVKVLDHSPSISPIRYSLTHVLKHCHVECSNIQRFLIFFMNNRFFSFIPKPP